MSATIEAQEARRAVLPAAWRPPAAPEAASLPAPSQPRSRYDPACRAGFPRASRVRETDLWDSAAGTAALRRIHWRHARNSRTRFQATAPPRSAYCAMATERERQARVGMRHFGHRRPSHEIEPARCVAECCGRCCCGRLAHIGGDQLEHRNFHPARAWRAAPRERLLRPPPSAASCPSLPRRRSSCRGWSAPCAPALCRPRQCDAWPRGSFQVFGQRIVAACVEEHDVGPDFDSIRPTIASSSIVSDEIRNSLLSCALTRPDSSSR